MTAAPARTLSVAVFLSLCGVTSQASCASWAVAHNYSFSNTVEVDTDSIESSGRALRYHNRYKNLAGEWVENVVWVNCEERTRGDVNEHQLSPALPGTRDGNEVSLVCAHAVRVGLLPAVGATTPAKPTPNRAGPKAPSVSPSPVEQPPPLARNLRSTGSGFVVGPYSVVTNNHVVDGCNQFKVRRDVTTYTATLRASTSRSDLALLSIGSPLANIPSIRAGAALGEDVMIAGHPLSGILATDLIVTSGQVNSLAGLGNDPTFLQISAPVQPGNSGGPVIDRSGAVVGVVVSKVNVEKLAKVTGDMAQNVNFAIKPEVLRMFLDANRVQYKVAPLGKRLDGVDLAERARAFTVQVLCYE